LNKKENKGGMGKEIKTHFT